MEAREEARIFFPYCVWVQSAQPSPRTGWTGRALQNHGPAAAESTSIVASCWRQNTIKWTVVLVLNIWLCVVPWMYISFGLYIYVMWCDFVYNSILLILLNLAVKFRTVANRILEPFDRCEAQLVIEDSWTAEVQNWSISVIAWIDCESN